MTIHDSPTGVPIPTLSPGLRGASGSQFTGSLSHFGVGSSVQGLTDEGPSFQELLEVHAL